MTNNPLISQLSSVPGVTVTLPTMGRFYPDGVLNPAADPQSFKVQPYSVWQETHWKDPYAISSGRAMFDMISTCCPDFLNPDEVAQIDADAIMVAARIASHGSTMDLEVTCSKCSEQSKVRADLTDVASQYVLLPEPDDWVVEFENGQQVQLRPILYSTSLMMVKTLVDIRRTLANVNIDDMTEDEVMLKNSEMMNLSEVSSMNFLLGSIDFVRNSDGSVHREREVIKEYLHKLPSAWNKLLTNKLEECSESIKDAGTSDFKCPECDHEQKIQVAGDPSKFFTPGSSL